MSVYNVYTMSVSNVYTVSGPMCTLYRVCAICAYTVQRVCTMCTLCGSSDLLRVDGEYDDRAVAVHFNHPHSRLHLIYRHTRSHARKEGKILTYSLVMSPLHRPLQKTLDKSTAWISSRLFFVIHVRERLHITNETFPTFP